MRPIAGMRVREELSHRGFPLVADGCLFSYHSHHSTPSLSSINLTRSSVTILLAQSAPIPPYRTDRTRNLAHLTSLDPYPTVSRVSSCAG